MLDKLLELEREIDLVIENTCERARLSIKNMVTSQQETTITVYVSKDMGFFVHKKDLPVFCYYTHFNNIGKIYQKTIGNYVLYSEKHNDVYDFLEAVYSDPTHNLLMPGE